MNTAGAKYVTYVSPTPEDILIAAPWMIGTIVILLFLLKWMRK